MRFIARAINQTAYVAPRTGLDSTGKPTYGTPVAMLVRAEYGQGVAQRGSSGTVDTTTARVFSLTVVGLQSRVWLPGAPVAALLASQAAPGNAALAAAAASAARLPGPRGCEANFSIAGALEHYLTELV